MMNCRKKVKGEGVIASGKAKEPLPDKGKAVVEGEVGKVKDDAFGWKVVERHGEDENTYGVLNDILTKEYEEFFGVQRHGNTGRPITAILDEDPKKVGSVAHSFPDNLVKNGGIEGIEVCDGEIEAVCSVKSVENSSPVCIVNGSPSKGSSFLLEHGFVKKKGNRFVVDDDGGILCQKKTPDKGYFSDQDSSSGGRNAVDTNYSLSMEDL
ncbi:unnamed protein product [Ilex paraguariensis]|uniref:Uncharacterized protein n=1 Tax=Ilex paraguariensis TaxID=185542 RepID=A0ABC8RSU5_9AQUA